MDGCCAIFLKEIVVSGEFMSYYVEIIGDCYAFYPSRKVGISADNVEKGLVLSNAKKF